MSLFASNMSMFESSIRKNGHSRYIACSIAIPPLGSVASQASIALPNPYQPGRRDTGLAGPGERKGHRAFARRRRAQDMGSGTADVVPILGDIGEMRKEAEGPNDQDRGCRGQAVQCHFEVAARRSVLVSAEAVLAYRVTKDAAEQPDVIAQREIFLVAFDCPRFRHEPTFWSAVSTTATQDPCLVRRLAAALP